MQNYRNTVAGRLLRACLALFILYRYCYYKACFVFIPIVNVAIHNKACFVLHIICTVCLESLVFIWQLTKQYFYLHLYARSHAIRYMPNPFETQIPSNSKPSLQINPPKVPLNKYKPRAYLPKFTVYVGQQFFSIYLSIYLNKTTNENVQDSNYSTLSSYLLLKDSLANCTILHLLLSSWIFPFYGTTCH